jgi:ornithine cyclodeaminase
VTVVPDNSHESDVLLLDYDTVLRLFPLDVAMEAMETAFRAHARGTARLFPVVREGLPGGAVSGIKSGYWPEYSALGLKIAGSWPANPQRGLESHQATVLLCDAQTGQVRALIDGNAVTTQRTAAAGALGLRLLARPEARVVAVLGAGVQAAAQIAAVRLVCSSVEAIRIWARDVGKAEKLAQSESDAASEVIAAANVADALRGSDIVITTTPSTVPLFPSDLMVPGMHINAMGADTRGKRELPPDLIERVRLVVDDREQARTLGESQPPVVWREEPPTLGEVLEGKRTGRTSSDEITVFDSTGVGLQDVASAALLFRRALQSEQGVWIPWRRH